MRPAPQEGLPLHTPAPLRKPGHYRHLRLAGCPRGHLCTSPASLHPCICSRPWAPHGFNLFNPLTSLNTGCPFPPALLALRPSCTHAHSVPVHTALLPAGLGCLYLQIPNPAQAVGLLEPLSPRQLLRWGPQPAASHQRPHTGRLKGSRSHTHVFGKERLLLLRVLGLLGLLHLQALNEGRSLRAKHGREGAR